MLIFYNLEFDDLRQSSTYLAASTAVPQEYATPLVPCP